MKNPLAQKHLRSVKKGDLVFYYHTGDEKAVVGIAKAARNAYPDPADKTGKAHVVDLVPVKKLKRPVTLAEIKADKRFKDFPLTYLPRLSVMPVTDARVGSRFWRCPYALAASSPPSGGSVRRSDCAWPCAGIGSVSSAALVADVAAAVDGTRRC